jgi:hypothetical protein
MTDEQACLNSRRLTDHLIQGAFDQPPVSNSERPASVRRRFRLTDVRRRIDARYDPDDGGGGIDRIFRDSSDELDDERGE